MKKRVLKILGVTLILISQIACMDKNIKNNLNINTIDYKSKEGKSYSYELFIPQVEDEVSEDITYFNVTMKEEVRYIIENLSQEENDGKIKDARISFKNLDNSFGVMSISILTNVYTGGAHYINKLESYNFSLKDNSLLTLEKVFDEEGIEEINNKLMKKISSGEKILNTQGKEVIFFENVDVDIRNSVLTFEGDTLVFTFQNYDLAPYSSGMPVFKFNRKDIKKYLILE